MLVLVVVLAVALFPLGLVRTPAEHALSAALGRPVTIGGLRRLDRFSLTPVVELTDVRIAQPAWAGPGDMARIADLRLRFAAAALLRGRFTVVAADVRGATFAFVRDANGRENWSNNRPKPGGEPKPARVPGLHHLGIADTAIHLADARRHVDLTASVTTTAAGLAIAGHGSHRGQPLTVTAAAGPLASIDPAAPYPFSIHIASPLVDLAGRGTMVHVLDTNHFTAAVATHGRDLADLDDIIQAGVPPSQPFAFTATVRHNNPDWIVTGLKGRLGRSDVAVDLTARRRGGRSILDGRLDAGDFDFDDLSSDAQKARAAEEERRLGKRILPPTAIHFEKLARTDGVIRFSARHLLSAHPSPFVALSATLTMDHRFLTVQPVTARLTHGTVGGVVTVDHHRGAPKLVADLDLRGVHLEDLFAIDPKRADVPVDGRIRLRGEGDTVRAALGRGDGTIDVFGQGGGMDYKVATLAAGDVVRGIGLAIGGNHDLAAVRCVDARFVARGGVLTARDLLLDTSVMRAGGSGTVDLSDERLALILQGRSKHPDIIQSTVPITIGGTLARATFDVVPVDRAPPKKTLLGKIGEVLHSLKTRGDAGRAEVAPDAPCGALKTAALGAGWDRRR